MITSLFRYGIKFAAWITPHAKRWHHERHINKNEGERHLKTRNWTEAENHFQLALTERKRTAPQTFDILLGLSLAQRKQGKIGDAEKSLQQAAVLAESSANRELQVRAMEATADWQLDRKDYSGAQFTAQKIEEFEQQSKTPDFKRLATTARKLGTALLANGRPAEAMAAFSRAAELSEKAFGPMHLETGDALTEMGARYRELGNHAEAQRCLRKALQIHREATGADSHQTTHDLFHLASSLAESGDIDGAASEYEKVLKLRERQVGADREQTADTQSHLALIYVRGGRTSAARELLTHAIAVLDRGKGSERLEFAFETMACLEDSLGHETQAGEWRERAAHSLAQRSGAAEVAPAQAEKYY